MTMVSALFQLFLSILTFLEKRIKFDIMVL